MLQALSTAGIVVIAVLTVRDWLATRDSNQLFLTLAIGCLGTVSFLGQAGKLLGAGFVAVTGPIEVILFLASGLSLTLFRDRVMPLKRRTRRLVIGVVIITALVEILIQLGGPRMLPRGVQFGGLLLFVLVWIGCVGEPSVRLWLASRGRTALQRARMRSLSLAYLAIVAILVAAVATASVASSPALKIIFAFAGVAILPLLFGGFAPPAWLRRAWRQSEEAKLQAAIHDLLLFAPDQKTMAGRALDWGVRLSGADSGFFLTAEGTTLSVAGLTPTGLAAIQSRVLGLKDQAVVPLGGSPPQSAIVVPLPGNGGRMVLVGGPFTPVFGSDDQAWMLQYAGLVSTGLDRVRLVEAVEDANQQLNAKVAEVTERTRQLEAANRELEAFSYTISHDLRAPLRAVNGFSSILLEEYADAMPPEARNYLRKVKDNGEHMGQLVDDLLAFSRLGRQALRQQPVSTRTVVERALKQLAPQMDGRAIEIKIAELPECEADPGLLEQVFVNLLSNAVKYSRKKEMARIEVGSIDPAGDPVTFFVRDNGAGFDMAYAEKLFGVFQRLHRSQDFEGTGVGLAIVQRIIDRHGGRIWAEAAVDQGATFYFTVKGAQAWQQKMAA
jgi:signal transduction histidine kinase